jgi:hypothetical protein
MKILKKLVSLLAVLTLIGASTVANSQITSIAGDFTQEKQDAWVNLANALTTAAGRETTSMQSYVSGLLEACNGATGKVMDMHAPNSIAMQILGFCTAAGDMEKERKFNAEGKKKSMFAGAPAYCGDLDQGINYFSSMPNTAEYSVIYPAAQALASAATKIKTIDFEFTPIFNGVSTFLGMDMRPKQVHVNCR